MLPLQEQRKKACLSQSELAAASGVKLRMIQHYERGYRDINGARLETLCNLAIAMNCKVCDIITDENLKIKLKKST